MSPNEATRICQIANPDVYLPCREEVDGLRCERLERHDGDHWLGEHTIRHRIAGAAVTCRVVDGDEAPAEVSNSNKVAQPKLTHAMASALVEPSAKPWRPKIIGIAFCVGIVLAVVAAYAFTHMNFGAIAGFTGSNGAITAKNHELTGWEGNVIDGTNPVQKALSEDGKKPTSPAAFIFDNGKTNEGRKTFDAYLDFANQKSRDVMLLNSQSLQAMVESGRIELRLHIVPSNDPFSIYLAEVLAEAAHFAPEKAWTVLMEALKFKILSDNKDLSPKEIAQGLIDITGEEEITDIDLEGLYNGTFTSWIRSVTDDSRLTVGTILPSIYVDGHKLDLKSMDLSKSAEFEELLTGGEGS